MKVVVSGATGHLGRYVVHELLARGHDVVAVSRAGVIPAPPFGETRRDGALRPLAADLCSDAAVAALAAELGPEVSLMHLAAWHPPQTASTGPAERRQLLEVNVFGTMRALDAARSAGAASVVYASTFEVYGEVEDTPIIERARVQPLTDYGATKLAGEDHLLAFADEERVRVVALRFPAIYGPGEHTPRALPNFLRAVARGQAPTIHGDGTDLRDQLHVCDAARACALALESGARGIFNVADGAPHSIAELARTAMAVAGLAGQPVSQPRVKPRRDYHMSIERASRELGFTPQVGLREGMAEELAWLRQGDA